MPRALNHSNARPILLDDCFKAVEKPYETRSKQPRSVTFFEQPDESSSLSIESARDADPGKHRRANAAVGAG